MGNVLLAGIWTCMKFFMLTKVGLQKLISGLLTEQIHINYLAEYLYFERAQKY
jgi:hypothetical protein